MRAIEVLVDHQTVGELFYNAKSKEYLKEITIETIRNWK